MNTHSVSEYQSILFPTEVITYVCNISQFIDYAAMPFNEFVFTYVTGLLTPYRPNAVTKYITTFTI